MLFYLVEILAVFPFVHALILIWYAIIMLVVIAIGESRGRVWITFLLALVGTPLLGLIWAVCMPSKRAPLWYTRGVNKVG